MNIKSAVLLVTGAAVAFAGATFYTKKTYENTIDHQLAIYKEVPTVKGVTMERTVIEEGFFWVNDEYRISLDPEFFNTMGGTIGSTTSLKFAVNNDCHIFPFYISCDNRFEPSNDKITQEMAQHLQKVPYESNWSLNALTRTIHSSFSVEDAVFEENGADITIHPLHLFSTTDFDLKEVQFELEWEGAMLALPEEKLTWQFSQLATRGEMSRVFGTTFVYSIKTKINNYGFYTPLADIFKGEHLSFSTETVLHNDDTFSVEYALKNALMQTFPPRGPWYSGER
ncbi:DUF945 family protein [Alteromonas pelagimontana]|uniref:DUF945 family protein n=1 Tax=Alteromonas pelagimontana TaxID=1858656 RepID=A0A6M4MHU2_9ALTE|nr:DUF945 family protein [Alteromonas pelagimontana]QJR82643.1 DUF945 family protein [Alteromonas pelagimontana]